MHCVLSQQLGQDHSCPRRWVQAILTTDLNQWGLPEDFLGLPVSAWNEDTPPA
ncbi:hypothetical protein ACRRTK_005994 [Alexandromys fortis]